MTPTQRILLNTAASYGRSVVSIALGLLSGRWILQALGADDYGVFGAVGAIFFFTTTFNGVLRGSIARFFAWSIGRGRRRPPEESIRDLREWFNVSLRIHVLAAIVFVAILLPIGTHAVECWLRLPPERIRAAQVVFRCSLVSAAMMMVSAPYYAMYTARQLIAELSLFFLLQSVLLVGIARWLLRFPGDRVVAYAVVLCALHCGIAALIMLRARILFPGCRFRWRQSRFGARTRELLSFAGWQFFGSLCAIGRSQGLAILIRRHFPLADNAAFSYAGQISGHSDALSKSLANALVPAITDAAGAGEHARAVDLAFRACKFGTLLVLLFAIPLSIECKEVVRLWLKTPPEHTAMLCTCMLLSHTFTKLSLGHMAAVSAHGRIALYQVLVGLSLFLTLPCAWVLVERGWGIGSIGAALLLLAAASTLVRVAIARFLLGMSIRRWISQVLAPLALLSLFATLPGLWVHAALSPSFLRILAVSAVCVAVTVVLGWIVVLDRDERRYAVSQWNRFRRKFA